MAGVDARDLHELAEELLAACEADLDTIPTLAPGLGGTPERSFIAPGEPAADCCPQLTVHVAEIREAPTEPSGLAAGRRPALSRVPHITLIVTLFRCVPTGSETKTGWRPPLTADIAAAAEQINADGWALFNHIYNRIRAGLLFQTCKGSFMDGMRQLTPQGGRGGWIMGIRVTLDGYSENLS